MLTTAPLRLSAACFENCVVALYKYVVPKPKSECSKTEQLGVSFAAGYIAGVFCAVVSQPADNLVSKLNSVKVRGHRIWWQGRLSGVAVPAPDTWREWQGLPQLLF